MSWLKKPWVIVLLAIFVGFMILGALIEEGEISSAPADTTTSTTATSITGTGGAGMTIEDIMCQVNPKYCEEQLELRDTVDNYLDRFTNQENTGVLERLQAAVDAAELSESAAEEMGDFDSFAKLLEDLNLANNRIDSIESLMAQLSVEPINNEVDLGDLVEWLGVDAQVSPAASEVLGQGDPVDPETKETLEPQFREGQTSFTNDGYNCEVIYVIEDGKGSWAPLIRGVDRNFCYLLAPEYGTDAYYAWPSFAKTDTGFAGEPALVRFFNDPDWFTYVFPSDTQVWRWRNDNPKIEQVLVNNVWIPRHEYFGTPAPNLYPNLPPEEAKARMEKDEEVYATFAKMELQITKAAEPLFRPPCAYSNWGCP